MDFLFGYDERKLKPNLKMASGRIGIVGNKRSTQAKMSKREVAKLLEKGNDEMAMIRVEHLIRDDFTVEAYNVIQLLCELLHERVKYLSSTPECPADLRQAVVTLIWASTRVDIAELKEVRNQFKKKFGKEFVEEAESDNNVYLNARVKDKLSVLPPPRSLVRDYMRQIAIENRIEWDDSNFPMEDTYSTGPVGYSQAMAPASGLEEVYDAPATPAEPPKSTVPVPVAPSQLEQAPPPVQAVVPPAPDTSRNTPPPPYEESLQHPPAPCTTAPASSPYQEEDAPPVYPHPAPPSLLPVSPAYTQPPPPVISSPAAPPSDATDTHHGLPMPPGATAADPAEQPSYDDLVARLAALKK